MMIVVLRHADRLPEPADGLDPAGIERAKLLARMLMDSGVTTAFCSEFVRTSQTLQPLKDGLGAALSIKPIAVNSAGGAKDHVQKIVAAVKLLPADAVVVIVSHSDTVGQIVKKLGGGPTDAIKEDEFDRMFILSAAPGGAASLLKLRYGAPTP